MRLLLLNYEYPPLGGGAGNATAHIAAELSALGARVLVVTSAFKGLPRRESAQGFEMIRLPALRGRAESCGMLGMSAFMLSTCLALPGIAREFKPQACLAFFGIPGGPPAYLLKLLRGLPYVVSLRGGDVPGFQPYDLALMHKITGPLIRFIWRGSGAVVANSRGLRGLAQGFAPEIAVKVIPNGVDTQRFHPGEGNSAGPCRLLFVGRVVRQKGLDVLFQALKLLPDNLAWSLDVVGEGGARPGLESLARELGLNDRINFRGWASREALPDIYRAADCFVFASRDEGMPNAMLEALASGLPVLASRISGNEELVAEGVNGRLAPVEDAAALAEGLSEIIADPGLRSKMGRASREIALRDYSWKEVAGRYLEILENVFDTSKIHLK